MDRDRPLETVAEQRSVFLKAMKTVQDDRQAEVGGHTWESYTLRYGPQILFAEIASITSRIEQLIWRKDEGELTPEQLARLEDLTVDLGNYSGFLFEWAQGRLSIAYPR